MTKSYKKAENTHRYENLYYLQILDTFENDKSFRVDLTYFVVLKVSEMKQSRQIIKKLTGVFYHLIDLPRGGYAFLFCIWSIINQEIVCNFEALPENITIENLLYY